MYLESCNDVFGVSGEEGRKVKMVGSGLGDRVFVLSFLSILSFTPLTQH